MITIREISNDNLIYFIRKGFENDVELLNYYDKGLVERSISAMVHDTYAKLQDYQHVFSKNISFAVYKEEEPIGYLFVTKEPNRLISFALNKTHRNKETLKKFFSLICGTLENNFECVLYSENVRGINWLIKCGMLVERKMNSLTILKFKGICQ